METLQDKNLKSTQITEEKKKKQQLGDLSDQLSRWSEPEAQLQRLQVEDVFNHLVERIFFFKNNPYVSHKLGLNKKRSKATWWFAGFHKVQEKQTQKKNKK